MNYPLQYNTIGIKQKASIIKHTILSNKFTMGHKCRDFESKFSKWIGCQHSLFVNSGSSANLLLLYASKLLYNLKEGDFVLVSALTWSTNVSPLIQPGLTPIFYDVSSVSFNVYQDNLSQIQKQYGNKIKLIFITNAVGIPHDLSLFKKYWQNTPIIQDFCQAQGCTRDGKFIGSQSEASTFSFYFGHHMTSIQGGMITTNNQELYKILLLLRNHGLYRSLLMQGYPDDIEPIESIDKQFLFLKPGFNFRNTEINALVGIEQLKRINKIISSRNFNHKYFVKCVDVENLQVSVLDFTEGMSSFCFPMVFKNQQSKNSVIQIIKKEGIQYRPIISGNIARQPFVHNYLDDKQPNLLEVDKIHQNGIYLGNSHLLSKKLIKSTIKLIAEHLEY